MSRWAKKALQVGGILLASAICFDVIHVVFGGTVASAPPEITGTDLSGRPWALSAYRGRPVVVDFFATWCGPCRQELPHLLKLKADYADRGLELVLLTREPKEELSKLPFLAKAPVHVLTEAGPAFDAYKRDAIPSTLYFDAGGKLVEDLEGYDEVGLERIAKRLYAAPRVR